MLKFLKQSAKKLKSYFPDKDKTIFFCIYLMAIIFKDSSSFRSVMQY